MKASQLVIGRTYFRLTFADPDLTMPGVEPLVFLGEVTEESGSNGFVFQDTASYVQFGSGLEGEEQHEDIVMYFLPESEIGALYDIEEVAVEIGEAARRAVAANHPRLAPRPRRDS
ncbi:MAG TPA: hypothetical protein VFL16_08305 [Steroidobacteraceae bacterium]|jgi:hypothetical protein|nr:hypothetical protein [Steroidobacteraceae bacterium]